MKWQQHSIVQIDQQGIPCRFTTGGATVLGWIMPDGMGVFQEDGIMVESRQETIATNHPEGLRLARQGAGNRHFHRHVQEDYTVAEEGAWAHDGDRLVKQCRVVLADIQGQLLIHATFKTGAAELLRFYTEFQSNQHARTHSADPVRQGSVGGQLHAGEVVRTASGRLTSPFPKIDTGSDRKSSNTLKRVEQWLMQNAFDEAQSRDDDFNALQFKASLSKPQQADKDCAEEFLFGQQPAVIPSHLKILPSPSLHKPT